MDFNQLSLIFRGQYFDPSDEFVFHDYPAEFDCMTFHAKTLQYKDIVALQDMCIGDNRKGTSLLFFQVLQVDSQPSDCNFEYQFIEQSLLFFRHDSTRPVFPDEQATRH